MSSTWPSSWGPYNPNVHQNSYPVMQLMRMVVKFIAQAPPCDPVDPTDVSLTITPPNDGAPFTVDYLSGGGIVRDDVGLYHYDYVAPTIGQWIYRFQGTGAVVASSGNKFFRVV